MALSVQTNNAAMTALKHLNANSAQMDKSLERLSSGFRVNNAADDASGYAVSAKLDAQTQRLKTASLNATQAQAMTKMADAGVNEIQNMVVRIETLATQASSANNAGELGKLDAERIKLESAIDKIANATNYNGVNLL
ncbi:MAG: flagellar protein, partial [Ghiorsea sp.]